MSSMLEVSLTQNLDGPQTLTPTPTTALIPSPSARSQLVTSSDRHSNKPRNHSNRRPSNSKQTPRLQTQSCRTRQGHDARQRKDASDGFARFCAHTVQELSVFHCHWEAWRRAWQLPERCPPNTVSARLDRTCQVVAIGVNTAPVNTVTLNTNTCRVRRDGLDG